MRPSYRLVLAVMLLFNPCLAMAQQKMVEREQEFLKLKPLLNEPLPDVTVFAADGSPFRTIDLKGHYTVLTFGCLTCPPSIWNISGLEAVHRDYSPKDVKFYFIYKALAHPELAGHFIQPFTQEERLAQALQAQKQFGTQIPWIVDAMDNRLKHALGDRPNSQFLVNPEGLVVRKRAWSNPIQVRKDLEELVGPVDHITREEDLHLELNLPPKSPAAQGVLERIPRPNMLPLVIEPEIEGNAVPFFAKLRAEADASLLGDGSGQLYLGFHLDPLHNAHWNNLTKPLSFQIAKVDGVELEQWEGVAPKVKVASDADPREFLVQVKAWPKDASLRLTVTYYACVGEEACHSVQQSYLITRRRDTDGGGARGAGAGLWNPEDFARQLMRGDVNQDGRLEQSELVGIALPHFNKLDVNHDGYLVPDELTTVAEWLNNYHMPGPPAPMEKTKSINSAR